MFSNMPQTPVRQPLWQTEGEDKRRAVQGMFAEIAPEYDKLNSLISLSNHHRWRNQAVALLNLQPGETILDLCCGTGDFAAPIREKIGPEGTLVGLDFCLPMLQVASRKDVPNLGLGDACRIPVRSQTIDAVTVGWGLRNVPDLDQALTEIARVLKPGGRLVSLDMAVPTNPIFAWGSKMFTSKIVPLLGKLTRNPQAYTYLPESTKKFATPSEQRIAFERAGLTQITIKNLMLGNICIVSGRKA